ncbi:MAG TPA: 3-dehydroquinate synthase [Verrucomicrobia bacterium]|nr:3-dehydroquinate synthase [Verrucomicrobiota bacterium]
MSTKTTKTIQQSFAAPFDYPVTFSRDVLAPANDLLAETIDRLGEKQRHRVSVFIDAGVTKTHKDLPKKVELYFKAHAKSLELAAAPRVVPGGEDVKGDGMLLLGVMNSFVAQRLSRHGFVLIIGGGAVLDAIGFAASLIHRGLRVIRMPTTALAQCDSGVGVKTSINWDGKKNIAGTFAPPFAVLNDFDWLDSLPDAEWSAGIAEAFKVAIIKDAEFFTFLCDHAARLKSRDRAVLEQTIVRCAELHLEHIRTSGDPFEYGSARPLDFGHWAAHKLEAMSKYRIGHGQAVAVGIALDSIYAAKQKWIATAELDRILTGLRAAGLTLWYPELENTDKKGVLDLLAGLQDFQEHLGGELCVTFPRGIGQKMEANQLDAAEVRKAIQKLKSEI